MNEQNLMNETIAKMHLSWLQEDIDTLPKFDMESLPPLKLVEGKLVKITVLTDKPFGQYTDAVKGVIKKKIPVMHNGEKKLFWLNKKNPLYAQMAKKLLEGETTFFISTTGSQAETKYQLFDPAEAFNDSV